MNKRISIIATTIALAVALAPAAAYADEAVSFNGEALGTDANKANAQTVYFAGSDWRVIGYGGSGIASAEGTATLLAANVIGNTYFNEWDGPNPPTNHYAGSLLQSEVNGIADAIPSLEEAAIVPRTLEVSGFDYRNTSGVAGEQVEGAMLWPLSTAEADSLDGSLASLGTEYSDYGKWWWLRSPGGDEDGVAVVTAGGYVSFSGYSADYKQYGVRPAFYLDLESVLFSSAAEGGKSGGAAAGEFSTLSGTSSVSAWKLTLKDSSRSIDASAASDTTATAGYTEWIVPVTFSSSGTGSNDYVSAILCDSDGNALYYGTVAVGPDCGSGEEIMPMPMPTGLAAGDYTLLVFSEQRNGDFKTDYASDFASIELTVEEPAPSHEVSVSADPENGGTVSGGGTFTYGETATLTAKAKEGYTFDYWSLGSSPNESLSKSANYEIAVTGTKSYVAHFRQILIVDAEHEELQKWEYTGNPITFPIKVYLKGVDDALEPGTDYEFEFKDNMDVGQGRIDVKLTGSWEGTATAMFDITPASISRATVEVADQVYSGKGLTPDPTVTYNGKTLQKDKDYTLSYESNIGVGTATVIVTGKGNFDSRTSARRTFKIEQRPVTITAASGEKAYDGKPLSADGFTSEGLAEGDRVASAKVKGSQTDAGSSFNKVSDAKIVNAVGDDVTDCYDIAYEPGTLTIEQKAVAITAASGEWTYDSFAHADKTVIVSKGELADGDVLVAKATGSVTDVTDTAEGNNPVAEGYKVMRDDEDATGNYAITLVAGTLTIKEAKLTITAKDAKLSYNGQKQGPGDILYEDGSAVTVEGLQGDDKLTAVTVDGQGDVVGEYPLTPTGASIGKDGKLDGNYDISFKPGTLTIEPAEVTITVNGASKVEGEDDPAFTGTVEGLVAEDDLGEVKFVRTGDDEAPGTYRGVLTATYTANANYEVIVVNGDFTIEEAPIKGTLTFDLGGGTLDGRTGTITIEANVGDVINLPGAPTREGYTFKYWKGSEYAAGAEYTVEGDHAFTAEWEKDAEPAPEPKVIPATGDPLAGAPFAVLALVALPAIAVCAVRRRRA